MKVIAVIGLIIMIVIAGCNTQQKKFRERGNNFQDMSEEERVQWMQERGNRTLSNEEMMQQTMDACEGKNEADSCILVTPRGEDKGQCDVNDVQLICRTNREFMQR